LSSSGMISRDEFVKLLKEKKVVEKGVGRRRGVSAKVLEILKEHAATAEALSQSLGVSKLRIYSAISYLRKKHGLKIKKYYNPDDGQTYYFLEE